MSILDISKMLMYEFYYDVIKNKYGDKAKLMYTDTDSFIIEIKTDDIYKDIKADIHHYDTSEYDPQIIYDIPLVNKKVPGKLKDEMNGKIMSEFLGLRSKLFTQRI
jgi:hypothetical protein